MGEIKSAWEIAMEKAKKVKELSLEELNKQIEDKCRLIGKALTDRYFVGFDLKQLEIDLNKYDKKEKELISKAVILQLIESLELGNYEKLDKIIEGIFYLKKDAGVKTIGEEIKRLFNEYKQKEQKKKEEIELVGKEMLNQLGISGDAIKAVNPIAKKEWQQSLEETAQPYEESLGKLKKDLAGAPS